MLNDEQFCIRIVYIIRMSFIASKYFTIDMTLLWFSRVCDCLCVCVCLFVVFCHRLHLDHSFVYKNVCLKKYIYLFIAKKNYRYIRTCSPQHGKLFNIYIIIVIFLLKMLHSEATASFACLECH